jgi:hypothetical protein
MSEFLWQKGLNYVDEFEAAKGDVEKQCRQDKRTKTTQKLKNKE